jgi:hypothetical protein
MGEQFSMPGFGASVLRARLSGFEVSTQTPGNPGLTADADTWLQDLNPAETQFNLTSQSLVPGNAA